MPSRTLLFIVKTQDVHFTATLKQNTLCGHRAERENLSPLLDLLTSDLSTDLLSRWDSTDRKALRLTCRAANRVVCEAATKLSLWSLWEKPAPSRDRRRRRYLNLRIPRLTRPRLRELHVSDFDDEGVAALVRVPLPALEALRVGCCRTKVSRKGAESLALGEWPALQYLSLNGVGIGSKGAAALSRATWPALTHLDLGLNKIGTSGAAALCRAKWPALTRLHLQHNLVGSRGAAALCRAEWPALEHIELDFNDIDHTGRCRS